MELPAFPATFTKFPASLAGPFADIEIGFAMVDWEVELVVVIGVQADHVAEADAWDHVAGLTIGQDISDRALQFAAGAQFSLGKSRRGYGPIGPWIVTPDEFHDADDLELGCSVNDEVVQQDRTRGLVFSVPRLIADLSSVLTLLPGDVIFTGTPAGVGIGRQPAQFLAVGDTLTSWIEGIGTIRNRCVLMATYVTVFGPHNPDETYVAHDFAEQLVDLGEVQMNYATVGDPSPPALLLIPGQTESWWGYEQAMPLLAEHFQVFAVDLRGQGRSTRTPGRYTLDNIGNDLVRFIDVVIGRPTIVSGLSSGGVLSAWLSAYAKPGQVARRALRGPAAVRAPRSARRPGRASARASAPIFDLWSTYLGDQWSIGDWDGDARRGARRLPGWMPRPVRRPTSRRRTSRSTTPSGAARSGAGPSPRRATTSGCCAA